jgi:thioredoxin 1
MYSNALKIPPQLKASKKFFLNGDFMGLEKVLTDSNFEAEVLKSTQPVLVDFWAEWCGPCKMLSPVIDRIATANQGRLIVGKMNVDENQNTPQQYGIQGIPTLLFFKNGQVVNQIVGFQSQDSIQEAIDEVINA